MGIYSGCGNQPMQPVYRKATFLFTIKGWRQKTASPDFTRLMAWEGGQVIAPKARISRMKGGDYRMFFSILSALCNILSFFIKVAEFILHIKDKRKK